MNKILSIAFVLGLVGAASAMAQTSSPSSSTAPAAVATSSTNNTTAAPVPGANSFTMAQAQSVWKTRATPRFRIGQRCQLDLARPRHERRQGGGRGPRLSREHHRELRVLLTLKVSFQSRVFIEDNFMTTRTITGLYDTYQMQLRRPCGISRPRTSRMMKSASWRTDPTLRRSVGNPHMAPRQALEPALRLAPPWAEEPASLLGLGCLPFLVSVQLSPRVGWLRPRSVPWRERQRVVPQVV